MHRSREGVVTAAAGGSAAAAPADGSGGWTVVIEPTAPWYDLRLRELWRYRDLVLLLVRRDFVAQYRQTVLGPLWHVVQPLLTTVAFTFVFGHVAGLSTDGLPRFLFYLSGTVVWGYFASTLTKTSNTFIGNAAIFGKVYFPRLAVPVSVLLSNLVSFGIQFGIFLVVAGFMAANGTPVKPNGWVLFTPVLLLLMAGLGLGLGITVSALTTRYRDLAQLVTFGVTLLLYATPVIYPLSAVPGGFRMVVQANPLSPIVEMFRLAFLGVGTVTPASMLYAVGATLAMLALGLLLFNRVERTFMDTV